MKKLMMLFVLGIFVSSIQAQETGVLTGTVTDDATDETLIGANVVMLEDKGRGASTDIDGKYAFSIPVGTHQIICSFTGMKADTITAVIEAGYRSWHER